MAGPSQGANVRRLRNPAAIALAVAALAVAAVALLALAAGRPNDDVDARARSATAGSADADAGRALAVASGSAEPADGINVEPRSELSPVGRLIGFPTVHALPRNLPADAEAYLGRALTVRQRLDNAFLHLASLRSQMELGAVARERYWIGVAALDGLAAELEQELRALRPPREARRFHRALRTLIREFNDLISHGMTTEVAPTNVAPIDFGSVSRNHRGGYFLVNEYRHVGTLWDEVLGAYADAAPTSP